MFAMEIQFTTNVMVLAIGHYLSPRETVASSLPPMIKPPSVVLKEAFDSGSPPTESTYLELGRKVLLPANEVKMWFEHLNTIRENRKKGAIKAANTRRKKKDKVAMNKPPSTVPVPRSMIPPTAQATSLAPSRPTPIPPTSTVPPTPAPIPSPSSPPEAAVQQESEYQCGVCI